MLPTNPMNKKTAFFLGSAKRIITIVAIVLLVAAAAVVAFLIFR